MSEQSADAGTEVASETAAETGQDGAPPPLRHNRDYVLWFVATAAAGFGSGVAGIALPLVAVGVGSSTAGLTLGAFYLALAVGLIPAGTVADRFDRRRTLMLCTAGSAVASAFLCVVVALDVVSPALLVAAAFVAGASMAVYQAEAMPVLGRLVEESQVSTALARFQSRRAVVQLAGPVLGGALFGVADWLPFVFETVGFLVVIVAVVLLRGDLGPDRDVVETEGRESSFLARASAGFRFIGRHRVLRIAAGMASLLNIVFFALFLLIILLAKERGASALEIGINEAVAGLGLLVGSLVAPVLARRYPGGQPAIVLGLAACAVSSYLMTLFDPVWTIGAAMSVVTAVLVVVNIYLQSYEMQAVPDELRGRTSAALQAVSAGLQWVGPLVVGVAATAYGAISVAEAVAILFGLFALCALLASPLRDLRLVVDP